MRYVALVDATGEQDAGQGADREHWHVLAAVRRPCTGNSRGLQPKTSMHTQIRIVQIGRNAWQSRAKPPISSRKDGRGGVNSQSGNFDPLRNYDRPSPPTKIIAPRSRRFASFDSSRLARFRPVYDPLERRERRWSKGEEGKVGVVETVDEPPRSG